KIGEDKRLIEETLKSFERNGLSLPAEKQAELKKLNLQLVDRETKISENIRNDKGLVSLAAEELEGVPLENLEKQKDPSKPGYYNIETGVVDKYSLIMRTALKEETRKKLFLVSNNRAKEANKDLIIDTINL